MFFCGWCYLSSSDLTCNSSKSLPHTNKISVSLKIKLTLVEICSSRNKVSLPSLIFFRQLTPVYCQLVICCWFFWRGQWCLSLLSHSLLFTMQVFPSLVGQLGHIRENVSLWNTNYSGKYKMGLQLDEAQCAFRYFCQFWLMKGSSCSSYIHRIGRKVKL